MKREERREKKQRPRTQNPELRTKNLGLRTSDSGPRTKNQAPRTKHMTAEEKYTTLKRIFWDYNTDKLPLDKAVRGELGAMDEYEYNLIFNRMLERLSWYELLDIVGADSMKRFLTKERISRLRFAEFREKYEFIRKILSGEPVSFTGWSDEFIKKHRQSLLSNRWYRTQ